MNKKLHHCKLYIYVMSLAILAWHQGKNYTGAPGDFAPEMQKRALENPKEPLKIAIDCNVKAC